MAHARGAAAQKIDGRRSRAATSRRRIVAALMGLIREGAIKPTAEAVAARADVGLRTVFRHFADMETLYREIAAEIDAELAPAANVRLASRRPRERLAESIELRVAVFERLMPFQVATAVNRHESPFLRERHAQVVELQRALLRRVLPDAVVADRTRFEALDLVLSFEAWLRLRREQGLSRLAALRVMQSAAQAMTR
jgi:AcrR family transcriptional regulator